MSSQCWPSRSGLASSSRRWWLTRYLVSSDCSTRSRVRPMRDARLFELNRLSAAATEADEIFQMDEDAFRLFYERTARPVWAYLARMSCAPRLADGIPPAADYSS